MSKRMVLLFSGLLCLALITGAGSVYLLLRQPPKVSAVQNDAEAVYAKLAALEAQVIELQTAATTNEEGDITSIVAERAMPTVVGISTITVQKDTLFGNRTYEGVGSGVIVHKDGCILTNSHVVGNNPKQITVYLKDGRETPGSVLWQDQTLDLAIVHVELQNLPVAILGDSDRASVGESVIAIGNPLGLRYERTVTKGIVSGLNRSIMISKSEVMEDLIQTDAAINPGNSGGPLINGKGEVIGINTVKAGAEGLGFAVPINVIKPIIEKTMHDGSFAPAYLGVSMFDREIAGYYHDIHVENGILITALVKNGPADKAGLKVNDIILEVDGVPVNTIVGLKEILYAKEDGDVILVQYLRNGKERMMQVPLEVYRANS